MYDESNRIGKMRPEGIRLLFLEVGRRKRRAGLRLRSLQVRRCIFSTLRSEGAADYKAPPHPPTPFFEIVFGTHERYRTE